MGWMQRLTHGFELVLPIQCVPDIGRLLTRDNIAIYQTVRYAQDEGSWWWHLSRGVPIRLNTRRPSSR